MNGILNINKPTGWTSHDVVAKIRGILKEKQAGHLGTLDPLARGVLPLAMGLATRLIEFASFDKEYVTTCLLGKTTDSCDVTGKVLSETPVSGLKEKQVRDEILKLKNIREQVPPMVSAVKSGGKKLYELARKGIVVERQARPVLIGEIEVQNVELPRVTFRVVCSAGTYMRVLCQSLGEVLGVGGCMESLQRTRVGPFLIQGALSLEEVKKSVEEGALSGILLSPSLLAAHLPEIILEEKPLADLCQGKTVPAAAGHSGLIRVLNREKRLCVIGEVTPEKELKPKKVFGFEGIL
jgi:tRNA pseudouridine55 synthase